MCKEKSDILVTENLSKMLQLEDQRLCQITKRIKDLKKEDSIILWQGSFEVNPNVLIGSFSFTRFFERSCVHWKAKAMIDFSLFYSHIINHLMALLGRALLVDIGPGWFSPTSLHSGSVLSRLQVSHSSEKLSLG